LRKIRTGYAVRHDLRRESHPGRVEASGDGYAAEAVAACVTQFCVCGEVAEEGAGLMVETLRRAAPAAPAGITANPTEEALDELKASLRRLLATLLDRALGIALDKVETLASSFDEIAARGGIPISALLGGLRAKLQGRSPIWGAIRGAFAALSPGVKALIIIALVLALLLLPVTVVLLLLALIVLAIWLAVRAGGKGQN
jgi:hypothetical protein